MELIKQHCILDLRQDGLWKRPYHGLHYHLKHGDLEGVMIYEIEINNEYLSPSGLLFKVLHLGKHAQDCSVPMVVFTNLVPTHDRPIGEIWVMEESLFMETYREKGVKCIPTI